MNLGLNKAPREIQRDREREIEKGDRYEVAARRWQVPERIQQCDAFSCTSYAPSWTAGTPIPEKKVSGAAWRNSGTECWLGKTTKTLFPDSFDFFFLGLLPSLSYQFERATCYSSYIWFHWSFSILLDITWHYFFIDIFFKIYSTLLDWLDQILSAETSGATASVDTSFVSLTLRSVLLFFFSFQD